jgi:hypothetical protein
MWNLLLPALAIAGGTYLGIQANQNAANTMTAAVRQQQAVDQQIANNANAVAAPAQSYLRGVMATSDTLTPAQVQQLELNRLDIKNQIHGSGFAGSGRTAEALFKKGDSDFVNTALDQNRNKAIAAADTLNGRATAADNALLQGAQAGTTGATTVANSEIATGKLYGQALGDVSSLINRQSKLQQV